MDYINTNWNSVELNNLIKELKSISDEKFKEFNDKIVNTKSTTIGVQIPKLRVIAKQISKGNAISFLNLKMPNIFELHIIYGLVLCSIKDNNIAYPLFKNFITTINNWAVCDIFCGDFKIVKNNLDFYLEEIKKLVLSNEEFVVRVGIILLMKFYIVNNLKETFNIISTITLDKYYVNMGIAWLLSMCYILNSSATLKYIENSNLNYFTKYKTYQKIIESRQVPLKEKEEIKKLRNNLKQQNLK